MSRYATDARVNWDGTTATIPDPGNGAWRVEEGPNGSKVYNQAGEFITDLSFKTVDASIADIIGPPA
ncbi:MULTISPECIES: hypothetical protein [Catenuloplanes]|uniref:Uncharacterized protein n=1 Tax=Catenuloplanes niger TaxID=587534 RepID=A0AAE3ZPV0_9ACTN|nr:hypothetical protein [Catenuloplanes niger]MDR7323356.1 hypothetical protein [Catenuloplanes niger]